jgi:hypothetical protein
VALARGVGDGVAVAVGVSVADGDGVTVGVIAGGSTGTDVGLVPRVAVARSEGVGASATTVDGGVNPGGRSTPRCQSPVLVATRTRS